MLMEYFERERELTREIARLQREGYRLRQLPRDAPERAELAAVRRLLRTRLGQYAALRDAILRQRRG